MNIIEENRQVNTQEVREGRFILESTPIQINIELTGMCNINPPCLFCSGKNFGHNYIPLNPQYLDKYTHFIDRSEHVNEDSFGEPLSHPGLIDLAQRHTSQGQIFSFVTNGLLLTQAKADKLAACGSNLGIHVSFNAASEETFYKLTGKSFSRVVSNVRYFIEAFRRQNNGANPDLVLTFIVMKINKHEVLQFVRLAADLGVRALLASLHDRPSVPLGDFGYHFVYQEEMLSYTELEEIGAEALQLANQLGIACLLQWNAANDSAIRGFAEPGVDIPCLIPWRFLFIQEHSSKVFGCPYHRNPYGDLSISSLEGIWNGEAAQEMRRSLAQGAIPKYCLDHSAGCPLVMRAKQDVDRHQAEADIIVGKNDFMHFYDGWHHLEYVPLAIRWTSQTSKFSIHVTTQKHLFISALVWGEHARKQPVTGSVQLAGQTLGRFAVTSDANAALCFDLPANVSEQVAEGAILVDSTWSPVEVGLGRDTRKLGLAVRRIWLE